VISFTIDLEDPTGHYDPDGRFIALTMRILDLCDEIACRATVFTVGRVAQVAPKLIKAIASRGHEIAYHSHAHVPLTEEQPTRFFHESKSDKDLLEQLSGQKIIGFRAPRFSLTPQSMWAIDILGQLDFRYSSSIMPTRLSLFGFPQVGQTPFAWPNGLIELPLPVAALGSFRIPYLGGIYLYALPFVLSKYWVGKAGVKDILWTYTHPYDFDRDEKFMRMPHTPLWASIILWSSRRGAEKKIRKILNLGFAPPLRDRLPDQRLTTFTV
jgi:polysaccharide deacetylase family protein (PEP-CTERM system associated)